MTESSDAIALSAWIDAVGRELAFEEAVDSAAAVDTVLKLASDVAHNVSRPAAPVTAFLVGVAAGRADDPGVAARDYAHRIARLAQGWNAGEDRGVAATEQSRRS